MNEPAGKAESGDQKEGGVPAVYGVGYGKPPAEHRFKKGQSGNPKGRPKAARNNSKPFNPAHQPTDSLILEEAYRPVIIREGEKVIELPAIQASMRALTIAAMKGSRLSQKALAEIVREVEDRRAKEHAAMLEGALDYKLQWKAEIERCEQLGLARPSPLPDPDDIIIDFWTGDVRTEGPLDEREKQNYDERLSRRADAQHEVNYFAKRYRRAKSQDQQARWLEEWHFEQRIFDLINDSLPPRYKVKLENRSYRDGASREGKTLQEFAEDRKRRKGKRKWGDYVEE